MKQRQVRRSFAFVLSYLSLIFGGLFFGPKSQAILPVPTGGAAPLSLPAALAVPPAIAPNLKPAFAQIFHYGPGVWVDPGISGPAASESVPGVLVGQSPYIAAGDGLFNDAGYTSTLNSAANLSWTGIIDMGLSSGAATSLTASTWVQQIESPTGVSQFLNSPAKMQLNNQSSGWMFLQQLGDLALQYSAQGLDPSTDNESARQVYWRHDLQVASYRAIGLNPMWVGQNPDTNPPIPPGISDYFVNIFAKFFYNEGLKQHLKIASQLNGDDTLGLLYKIFADNLNYEAGLMNFRYAPIDASCRYRDHFGNCLITSALPASELSLYSEWFTGAKALFKNIPLVNFGTAGDFATVYDVIKFFSKNPETDAVNIASGNISSFVTSATNKLTNTYSISYPSAVATAEPASVVAVAKALFDDAYNIWLKLDPIERSSPQIYLPRVSSALIAAAVLIGKRVDPTFWGMLAEAEQALMKNNPNQYKTWADNLLADPNFAISFAFALWDFGKFHPSFGAWTPASLTALLSKALDPSTKQFALVQGPGGLDAIDTDRVEMPAAFENPTAPAPAWCFNTNSKLCPMPFPNAFLESAETGRAIIDGRLLFTPDGKVQAFDIDDSLSTKFMPFEQAVINTYQRTAGQSVLNAAVGSVPAKTATLANNSQTQVGSALPATVQSAEGDFLGSMESEPLNANSVDSLLFQPSLEYWLVISNLLSTNGISSLAGYTPPEFKTISYNPRPQVLMTDPTTGVQYGLMNIVSPGVTMVVGRSATAYNYANPTPMSNAMPLDSYQSNPTYAAPGTYVNDFLEEQNQVIKWPFISVSNPFLEAYGTTPAPTPASGAGSAACKLIPALGGKYPLHDPTAVCP